MTEGERIATKWKTLFAYNKTCAELAADIDAALASARPAQETDFILANLPDDLKTAWDELRPFVNGTPEVLSLLYDLDLMPEQIMNRRNFVRMLQLAEYFKLRAARPAMGDDVATNLEFIINNLSSIRDEEYPSAQREVLNLTIQRAKAVLAAMGDDVVRILSRLVKLKEHKDKFGKDNFYIINQPQAWKDAEAVLAAIKSEKLHG